jgi:hypothetical protein
MSVSVRKATEDDLYKVYVLLSNSTLNSAWIPLEMRRRMFQPVWAGSEGYYGYVMENDDEVVGFLGTLFTEREIAGEKHKFCEIHSWYVKEQFRNRSMNLFLPVMSMRKVTLLNYTPTQAVYDISKKFGWSDLETALLMFLPVPTPWSLKRGIEVETRKHVIFQHLDEADKQIFLDHVNVPCRHFLIREKKGTGYAYVIVKKLRLGRLLPFGRIVYASNNDLLFEYIDRLRLYWCLRLGLLFMAVDQDQAETTRKLRLTRKVPRKVPSLYKSKALKAEDIKPPLYNLPLLIGYRLH